MNISNVAIIRGRLTSDPVAFQNKDGSTKIKATVAVTRNFKNAKGEKDTDFIPIEAFVRAGSNNPWSLTHKGDLIGIEASIRSNNYTDKNGQTVYSTIIFAESLSFEESKAVTDARRAAQTATEAAPVAPEAPTEG